MALETSYIKLEINYAYAQFVALSAQARRSLALGIGKDETAAGVYVEGAVRSQRRMGLVRDSKSLWVGRGGLTVPLEQLWLLGERTRRELSEYVNVGAMTAKVVNAGRELSEIAGIPSNDPAAWGYADGFVLTGSEITRFCIEPRILYKDIIADPALPAADSDRFIYIPQQGGLSGLNTLVIEVSRSVGASVIGLSLYAFNPITSAVYLDSTEANVVGRRIEMLPSSAWIHPVVTGIAGDTLRVHLGANFGRSGV